MPVRPALRVVSAYGADAKVCKAYWFKVNAEHPTPWDGCHNEFKWIVLALLRAGWSVWAEFR